MIELQRRGGTTQLQVDGQRFLMLGGELGNSSASSLDYMESIWPKLERLGLNTVLAPIYWELIEAQEGQFDFSSLEGLIVGARRFGLKLVLLWFGSWKNSMSCYAPEWVKRDAERFPRARLPDGSPLEIVSAFSPACRNADCRAFAALMRRVRQLDGETHSVLMVQVENEVALVDSARDHSDLANTAFAQSVPEELIDYLRSHRDDLVPEVRAAWQSSGFAEQGTWTELFGVGEGTEEMFMAWYFGRYVNAVAEAGKAEYALPMFANAALNRPGKRPGEYPSAGPLPHLFDVWKAAAPSLDFLAPDIYFGEFAEWCARYARPDNPLFIPETTRGDECGVNALFALGELGAMGFCPFSVESIEAPEASPLAKSYRMLHQLTPLILEHQGGDSMRAVLLGGSTFEQALNLGNLQLTVVHEFNWEWSPHRERTDRPAVGVLFIALGDDEYLVAGSGVVVRFASKDARERVGFLSIDEGQFFEGQWLVGRRLNGDQSHQGRHVHLSYAEFGIQRVELYRYR